MRSTAWRVEPRVAATVLRTTGFLRPDLVELVTDWFLGEPTASEDAVRQSYRALERETERLYEIVCRARSSGGLGVRVHYVRHEPYGTAARALRRASPAPDDEPHDDRV